MVIDPALNARVTKHKEDMSVYASTAVQEGEVLGLIFTAQEFTIFVMAERSKADAGVLSDLELDAVAGGVMRTKPNTRKYETTKSFKGAPFGK